MNIWFPPFRWTSRPSLWICLTSLGVFDTHINTLFQVILIFFRYPFEKFFGALLHWVYSIFLLFKHLKSLIAHFGILYNLFFIFYAFIWLLCVGFFYQYSNNFLCSESFQLLNYYQMSFYSKKSLCYWICFCLQT